MKCPHCLIAFHDQWDHKNIGTDMEGIWSFLTQTCPVCKRFIMKLIQQNGAYENGREILVWPMAHSRATLPTEVPNDLAEDYNEACRVLTLSPKASAALSRRCLQHFLHEQCHIIKHDLCKEIQEAITTLNLPSQIADSLDAIRIIGNFAAHPFKSTKSGEIFDVEPGEAELNLDVLEALFDFHFVQPQVMKKKREVLNQKLVEAGKKPMK